MTQKEKVLGFMKENMKIPMTAEEIAVMLSVPKNEMTDFFKIVEELEREAKIVKTKKKRYATCELLGLVIGKFIGFERGFGFVEAENADRDDIFIGVENMGGALHGDAVMVRILGKSTDGKQREGEVVKIVSAAEHKIVGRFSQQGNNGFIIPVNRRYSAVFHVDRSLNCGAKNGDMVIAEIVERGNARKCHEVKVKSILGNISTPGIDVISVIESRNIPYEFSLDVINEAKCAVSKLSQTDINGRLDLRNEQIITIDGEDAKDLDDAVHVKRMSNGNFELGVHIADVGHYVPLNSKIDHEAYIRGTSIYLADRVIPMLPKELSNGICSLNEGEDRLTISVIMEINQKGDVVDRKISESVIRSSKRMTYAGATAIIEGDKEKRKKFPELTEMLDIMAELRNILRKKRMARGSIDFNFDEAKIVLDEKGKSVDILKCKRGISDSIIEEFMLVCNETVAEYMFWLNIPFIYRVHEEPNSDTVIEFAKFIELFGYKIKHSHGKIHPREFAELIKSLSGKREEKIIGSFALRSLMKARYDSENLGHFGLAAEYYCHFTSPIRRYPDLAVHRIIKEHLNGTPNLKKLTLFTAEAAKQSGERELEAVDLERTVEDIKRAELMQERIGDVYDAVITHITQFGLFASLENTIEGLIRLSDLDDDYYIYDEKTRSLLGERSGKTYRVGDEIEIYVVRADTQSGKVYFAPNSRRNIQKNVRTDFLKKSRERDAVRKKTKAATAKYLKKKHKKR